MTPAERMAKEQEIRDLTNSLSSPASEIGDYRILKCYEYTAAGLEPPYDIEELHQQREAVRERINELRQELDE